jgi:glycosyltransferase involved in cell wall biosynthesis
VLPFKMGGGIRLKSLTALASGIPIVSTSLGVEGLKVKANQDFLLADSEKTFANKTIKLLKDSSLQNKLSKNSKKYIQKNHSLKNNHQYLKRYLAIT